MFLLLNFKASQKNNKKKVTMTMVLHRRHRIHSLIILVLIVSRYDTQRLALSATPRVALRAEVVPKDEEPKL